MCTCTCHFLQAAPELLRSQDVQLVCLGSGTPDLEVWGRGGDRLGDAVFSGCSDGCYDGGALVVVTGVFAVLQR